MSKKPPPPDVEKPVTKPVAIVPMQPGRNGGQLRRGALPGTNKGGGRTTEAFKEECRKLADKGAKAARAKKVLDDPDHKEWLGAWKFVTEQGHGKAKESVEHSGDPNNPVKQVIEVVVRKE